jgi:hypothetical protein
LAPPRLPTESCCQPAETTASQPACAAPPSRRPAATAADVSFRTRCTRCQTCKRT